MAWERNKMSTQHKIANWTQAQIVHNRVVAKEIVLTPG